MKIKILKIIVIYSLIIIVVSLLATTIYKSVNIPKNRIVKIDGHEYIESGIRRTSLIHSESCQNKSHKKD